MRLSARAIVAAGAALTLGVVALDGASGASAATTVRWATARTATVHPGVQVGIAGVRCIAGFVMTDGHRVFVAVPGSCAGVDDGQPTNGCTAAQVPYGLKVRVQGARYRGRIAYSSYTEMQLRGTTRANRCANNALVLVRLDDRDIKRTNPSLPAPTGGPTGLATTAPEPPVQLTAFVNGAATPSELMENKAAGWAHTVYIGPVFAADQLGSPVLTQAGRALGMITLVPQINGAPVTVSNLAKEIAFMQTVRGFGTVHLARGTRAFTAARRRVVVGGSGAGEHLLHLRVGEPAELSPRTGAVEDGHLELVGSQRSFLAVLACRQRAYGEPDTFIDGESLVVSVADLGGDDVGVAAHDDETLLVGDAAVVGEPEQLVVSGGFAYFGDGDLDLERLLTAAGEDRPEDLRVGVRERAAGHVPAVVRVAAEIGHANAGHAEVLELVVLAHRGEGNPVVDLRDLVQRD